MNTHFERLPEEASSRYCVVPTATEPCLLLEEILSTSCEGYFETDSMLHAPPTLSCMSYAMVGITVTGVNKTLKSALPSCL
eukprot:CAMPEP_0174370986 /NCGR_PEP_ID=MMETSP0811_2-20130205/98133_1 /TAXON_ID=73025 ORGANISM="Eutreptiella gymnastica-like, Strain CCMP1594" /NCGR_SAMPLE_ID=MMETSP0811_2 /ASSEMBLY_ACC=CAM_ASM_000667 /LENGTH=80 /DNA_ID=CAMNT_0015516949 /DNA_START=270 /DNA_END=512 /DNA_ORIENTATION=+